MAQPTSKGLVQLEWLERSLQCCTKQELRETGVVVGLIVQSFVQAALSLFPSDPMTDILWFFNG